MNTGSLQANGKLGGIVGCLRASSDQAAAEISDCENSGVIEAKEGSVGGIAGYIAGSQVERNIQITCCKNTGTVSGTDAVGGIAGYAFYKEDKISSCYNSGQVIGGESKAVGGIVGYNRAAVLDVYNLGNVQAIDSAGGIIGTAAQIDSVIKNAYHAGQLEAAHSGAICGYVLRSIAVQNCHSLYGETSGSVAVGQTVTGAVTIQTTETLMQLAEKLGSAFRTSDICPQRYPVLYWQHGPTHSYDAGTQTAAATCTQPGEIVYTCHVCGMCRREAVEIETCPSQVFQDVPTQAWYHNAVDFMLVQQYMSGMGNGLFEPDALLTRAQLVSIVYRLAGSPAVQQNQNPFTDVPAGMWYTDAVCWATENKVVYGTQADQFSPDDAITREQIAAILYRYLQASPAQTDRLAQFPDTAAISDYAVTAMNWAVSAGIISGSTEDNGSVWLLPRENGTRAQIAQIFMNWMNL